MAPERWQWSYAVTTVASTAPLWVCWYMAASLTFESVLAGFIGAGVLGTGFFWIGLVRHGTPADRAVARSLVEGRLAPGAEAEVVVQQAEDLRTNRVTPRFLVGLAVASAMVAVVHGVGWGASVRADVGSALVVVAFFAAARAQVTLRRRARTWTAPMVGS